jgi:hypothetical protein
VRLLSQALQYIAVVVAAGRISPPLLLTLEVLVVAGKVGNEMALAPIMVQQVLAAVAVAVLFNQVLPEALALSFSAISACNAAQAAR